MRRETVPPSFTASGKAQGHRSTLGGVSKGPPSLLPKADLSVHPQGPAQREPSPTRVGLRHFKMPLFSDPHSGFSVCHSAQYILVTAAKIYYSCLLILQFPSLLSRPSVLFMEDSASPGLQDSRPTRDTISPGPQGPTSWSHRGPPLSPIFLLCLCLLASSGARRDAGRGTHGDGDTVPLGGPQRPTRETQGSADTPGLSGPGKEDPGPRWEQREVPGRSGRAASPSLRRVL